MSVRTIVCNNSEGNDTSGCAQCGLSCRSGESYQELSGRAVGVTDDRPYRSYSTCYSDRVSLCPPYSVAVFVTLHFLYFICSFCLTGQSLRAFRCNYKEDILLNNLLFN